VQITGKEKAGWVGEEMPALLEAERFPVARGLLLSSPGAEPSSPLGSLLV